MLSQLWDKIQQYSSRFAGLLYLLFSILIPVLLMQSFFGVKQGNRQPGVPVILHDAATVIPSCMTQILDDGQRLYILYDDRGTIQVYDLYGNYQYTIAIYTTQNGSSEIAVRDEMLYVEDRSGSMYIFQGDELVEYIESNDSTRKQISSLRKELGMYQEGLYLRAQSKNYKIRFASIWRIAEGEEERCVVKRPVWLTIFQIHPVIYGLAFIFFVFLPIVIYDKRKR